MRFRLFIFTSIFLSIFVKPTDSKLQMRIMQTSILNFAPCLKLHHLVLLANCEDLYTIDFTPIDQQRPDTLLKLLTGQNVPAEIRLRCLKNTNMYDDKTILKMWDSNITEKQSRELSESLYNSIQDNEIKEMFDRFLLWENKKQYMNLYTRNCQHFGDYAIYVHQNYME
jgi:hypothetical protein